VDVDAKKVDVIVKGAIAKNVTRNGKCMAQHGADGQHGN
jgi:hypothetical protein